MVTVKVNLKNNAYKIYIGKNIAKEISLYMKRLNLGNFCVAITNKKILSLHKRRIKEILSRFSHKIVIVPQGENAKSKTQVFRIIKEIIKIDNPKTNVFLACIGGGTVGDLGGFVASIYKRGIPYVQIPTTLLSCVDASIGGKTAINFLNTKNVIGTFYQPKAVFIDHAFLSTLPNKEIKEGLSEVIKYAVIKSEKLFTYLENKDAIKKMNQSYISRIIKECVKIKAKIVEEDEKETKGIRTILNFGHTIGHALEASSCGKITHGKAVAVGMVCAGYISTDLGLCKYEDVQKLKKTINSYSLPTSLSFSSSTLLKYLFLDKKFIYQGIRMVLMEKIGKVKIVNNIPLEVVKRGLRYINNS